MADVRDGLSNTILLAERRIRDGSDATYTVTDLVYAQDYPGGPLDPNGAVNPAFATSGQIETAGQKLKALWPNSTTSTLCPDRWAFAVNYVNEQAPPNWKYPEGSGGCGFPVGWSILPSRSNHPGGVNVAAADGSVHFVSETIDLVTWQNLGARADGTPVSFP